MVVSRIGRAEVFTNVVGVAGKNYIGGKQV